MSKFHICIKALLESAETKQNQLADYLGIRPQNMSYYINGREPSYDMLCKIADYFSVSVDYLLGHNLKMYIPPFNKALVDKEVVNIMNNVFKLTDSLAKISKELHGE